MKITHHNGMSKGRQAHQLKICMLKSGRGWGEWSNHNWYPYLWLCVGSSGLLHNSWARHTGYEAML